MTDIATLPELLTEEQAAKKLGVSAITLQRLRLRGRIECHKIGRLVRYTEKQLTEYLETARCRAESDRAKLETTGSQKGQTPKCGAAPGLTEILGKPGAKALALQTLKRPS